MTGRGGMVVVLAALLGLACGDTDDGESSSGDGGSGAAGGGDVDCSGTGAPVFPTFDKTCTSDADCVFGLHQVDCCGTRAAIGLSTSASDAFDAAESICEMQYPGCGCPQGPTTTEDGKTATGGDGTIQVACAMGECSTFIP